MQDKNLSLFIKNLLNNVPKDWINLTTHRLDIYNEELAKTEFLQHFEELYQANEFSTSALSQLPTAFDYIRLGHPLSCVLEWYISKNYDVHPDSVISFSSITIPLMAILRKNLFEQKNTLLVYKNELPECLAIETLQRIYRYNLETKQIYNNDDIPDFDGTIVYYNETSELSSFDTSINADFLINVTQNLGSILLIATESYNNYTSEIQHVRRRETIAMTPSNTLTVFNTIAGIPDSTISYNTKENKNKVQTVIKEVTGVNTTPVIGSSGLSIQYAIVMGLIDYATEHYNNRQIKIVVPPNCYGGTNDQARRIVACLPNVEIMDLPVDGGYDMVSSIDRVLATIAEEDAVPFIIAEIPTNPRVEVPNLEALKNALSEKRKTKNGENAIAPVFILDQTFCPNVHFLGDEEILSTVQTIAYVSGSKFPSGGKCTAGYCTANTKAAHFMSKIQEHIQLCDNEATELQIELLAEQLPSMNRRIHEAYKNTREFVRFIEEKLPDAKINFVSEELASQGFTPSVFSLDLPTKGTSETEREMYKRELNHKLISMMITQIPDESKYCVSYGQLKGCYWTIPATSTQGTTKEDDKDYIARVAVSPNLDLERHKEVFLEFINEI